MNNLLITAKIAAEKAAHFIYRNYSKTQVIVNKNPRDISDYVTNIDRRAEKIITDTILSHFPDHGIWGEEFGRKPGKNGNVWVIDPIDGTKNFTRRLGQFAISIGFVKDSVPWLGVIRNPLEKGTIYASRGKGAYKDNRNLRVSFTNDLRNSAVAINLGKTKKIRAKSLRAIVEIYKDVPIIRMPGSTAFTIWELVQQKYDALIDNGDFWDFAASIVIVQEAGGKVSTWTGEQIKSNSEYVFWSNGLIHQELLKRISKLIS